VIVGGAVVHNGGGVGEAAFYADARGVAADGVVGEGLVEG